MREMYKAMKLLYGKGLALKTALVTDGRFSGTNNGCFVGHISPEAAEGGPIAAVLDGDGITIDIALWKFESSKYVFTIIDAPRVSPKVAASLAAASKTTLVVLQMSVKDVRVARELRGSLLENGIPAEQISLVINRYRKKGTSVSLAEVRRAVGSDNIRLVGNDFRPAARSIDLGEPLAKAAPRSSLREDVRKLLVDMTLKSGLRLDGKS